MADLQPLVTLVGEAWDDYGLVDSGGGRKLERYGPYCFIRPEPQAMWAPATTDWRAAAEFVPGSDEDGGGRWNFNEPVPRDGWPLKWNEVRFTAQNTPFRHLGFFPDMAPVWSWMREQVDGLAEPECMNLFGYTGVGTLAMASAGANPEWTRPDQRLPERRPAEGTAPSSPAGTWHRMHYAVGVFLIAYGVAGLAGAALLWGDRRKELGDYFGSGNAGTLLILAKAAEAVLVAVTAAGIARRRDMWFVPALAGWMAGFAVFAVLIIVSVGALIPRKGHDIVIRALSHVPGARLLIAGTGPERENLIALARQTGVGERVQLLGDVAHDRIPSLLGEADAMALASKSEGLANAWVEALACGTPIVITEAGGAREVVTDAAYGRIVARTPEAFAAAIAELLAAPPAPDAVRKGAERFTWEANTAALFAHLSRLVAGG